jgi:hypothetical protein
VRILRLWVKTGSFALVLIFSYAGLRSQSAKAALAPIPFAQRATFRTRLTACTEAFREKDFGGPLYDLVSDNSENGLDGSLKITRRRFVYDMQNTYDLQRLIKLAPAGTEADPIFEYDVYGCAEIPYGNPRTERIAAVLAVMGKPGDWVFVDWDCVEPPTSCSVLMADPKWKPQVPRKLEGPTSQVSCEILTRTL